MTGSADRAALDFNCSSPLVAKQTSVRVVAIERVISRLECLLANLLDPHIRLQDFRHEDAAVGLLIVFHDRDDRAAARDGRAVERVDELGSLLAFGLVANLEPAGLIVGAVACASDFAKLAAIAAAGHPGFEIELAIGRPTEVTCCRVDDAIVDSQLVEDATFQCT